ncbi:MAG: O-antigen ligase family protein [Desulfobulbaceae bacterium]|nr:O-antigen ligase family protein [Desulfobulbaceae bacterium]
MKNREEVSSISYSRLFSSAKNWPYFLLLVLLAFNSFRPDRLLPGGAILIYFPIFIIILLFIAWIIKQNKVIRNTQTKFYFLLIILMLIQLPFVRNYGLAFPTVKATLLYGITTYLFLIQFIDTYPRLNQYIRLYTIFGVFLAVVGLTSAGRVNIPMLRDENDFSLYINCLIPFAFFLIEISDKLRKKIFYSFLIVILISANVASFSRGGFVGLVAVGIYLFLQSKNKLMYSILAIIAVIGLITYSPQEYMAEIQTINTESHKTGTGFQRVLSWSAAWEIFKDHPIMGVGIYNYGPWLPEYWEGEKVRELMWGRVPHSLYFTLLSEMGIIGTLIFLIMLIANMKDHRRICHLERNKDVLLRDSSFTKEEKEKIASEIRALWFISKAVIGALVAYLVTGIFISVLWYEYFWRFTAFLVLAGNIADRTNAMILDINNNKAIKNTIHKKNE